MSTQTVYVLSLEGGRYYIGKSDNVMNRYHQHLNGKGSAWTRKYKPVSLVKTIENTSPFDEDRYVKEYMSKYGIEKVRGGSYVEVELSMFQKNALKAEIWAANDLCTNCGRAGHFVKDCYATTDVSGNTIEYEEDSNRRGCEYYHEKSCVKQNADACYRCGRTGHYSSDCYARTHHKGYILESECDSESESGSEYESESESEYDSD